MSSASTHLGLVKPVTGDAVSVLRTSISSNADTVDTAFGRASGGLQEGAIDAGSHMVTQKGAGANMSVDVASSTGSGVYVQDDSVSSQALYYVAPTVAVTNVAVTTAHATLPRIDRVVIALDGTISVVAGTATAGATLNNLTGAAGVPSSKLLLADILVAATVTTIPNSVIRDRRKWARGAYCRIVRNSNASAGNDYQFNITTLVLIDGANLAPRIECSGAPVRVTLSGSFAQIGTTATNAVYFSPQVDSVGVDGMGTLGDDMASAIKGYSHAITDLNNAHHLNFTHVFVPSPGSHVISPAWATAIGGSPSFITARASAARPLIWTVEELPVQNTANNTTTTG